METIQACVNQRLLTKADRLFTGTLNGRIIELLQNARRAGATKVTITNDGAWVTVRDNGLGISDFAKLLDLGGSGVELNARSPRNGQGRGDTLSEIHQFLVQLLRAANGCSSVASFYLVGFCRKNRSTGMVNPFRALFTSDAFRGALTPGKFLPPLRGPIIPKNEFRN